MTNSKYAVSPFLQFCIGIMKIGRVPRHLAFIMDGNRRFMKKHTLKGTVGHSMGYDTLWQVVEWCRCLCVSEISTYVFSIENFKRTEEEITGIMDLFRDKFRKLLSDIDQLNEKGIRIRVVGRLSLLDEDIRILISEVTSRTKNNSKLVLNLAIAYTGRDEISRAASRIRNRVRNKELSPEDIDEQLVSETLDLSEPDLLVRTSGEVRLSDFMLWQISDTVLYFSKALWPEFTVWHFLAALIHFQRHAPSQKKKKYLHT